MKKYLLLTIILLVLSLFQSIYPIISFVLVFCLGLAFADNKEVSMKSAFIGGFILDMLGTSFIGLYTVLMVVCMLSSHLLRRIFPRNVLYSFFTFLIVVTEFNIFSRFPNIVLVSNFPLLLFMNSIVFLLMKPLTTLIDGQFKKSLVRGN